jgi:CCR4-NOT complex subunit CAF16
LVSSYYFPSSLPHAPSHERPRPHNGGRSPAQHRRQQPQLPLPGRHRRPPQRLLRAAAGQPHAPHRRYALAPLPPTIHPANPPRAANGAGKTTILRLLSGARLAPAGSISLCGLDPFKDNLAGITYLGSEWAGNPIVRRDIRAGELLDSVAPESRAAGSEPPGAVLPPTTAAMQARRSELVEMLEVDPLWRMHAVSDGQRRRVQLVMGLLRPWRVLLLDEVTADLDVAARRDLLSYLVIETQRTQCQVVYATHVLDGLEDWATHWGRLVEGRCRSWGRMEELRAMEKVEGKGWLIEVVVGWIRAERVERNRRLKESRGEEKTGSIYSEPLGGYGMEKSRRE